MIEYKTYGDLRWDFPQVNLNSSIKSILFRRDINDIIVGVICCRCYCPSRNSYFMSSDESEISHVSNRTCSGDGNRSNLSKCLFLRIVAKLGTTGLPLNLYHAPTSRTRSSSYCKGFYLKAKTYIGPKAPKKSREGIQWRPRCPKNQSCITTSTKTTRKG